MTWTRFIFFINLLIFLSSAAHDVAASSAADVANTSPVPEALYMPHCRRDLGMHSREIPDSAITASSSYDERSVGPINARIRTEQSGGAWCPKQQITRDVYEWLQVDVGKLAVISLVETQGRFGNGQGQEYTTKYRLEYQREDDGRWFRYKNHNGSEVLRGNINTYIAEMRELHPPIIARRVRFVPVSNHPRTVCMRVELFGCDSQDGILSYSMRQGDRRGSEVEFSDFTYDGDVVDGQLSGGLGQLVDGDEGASNFRLDIQNVGRRGYEWVGWKTDGERPAATDPVEIVFRLDAVRSLTAMRIHCNNAFSRDVGVFSAAELHFSVGGKVFDVRSKPVFYMAARDSVVEQPRYVTVPIQPARVARFIRLLMNFDRRWIMISEVHFDTDPVSENYEEEDYNERMLPVIIDTALAARTATTAAAHFAVAMTTSSNPLRRDPAVVEIDLLEQGETGRPRDASGSVWWTSIRPTSRESSAPVVAVSGGGGGGGSEDMFVAIVLGCAGAFVVIVLVVGVIVVFRWRSKRSLVERSPLKSSSLSNTRCTNFSLNYLSPSPAPASYAATAKVSNGVMYKAVATCDKDNSAPAVGALSNHSSSFCKLNNAIHSSPMISQKCIQDEQKPWTCDFDECVKEAYVGEKSAAVSQLEGRGESVSSSMTDDQPSEEVNLLPTAAPDDDCFTPVISFPPDIVTSVEILGEGIFGEVHICEVKRLSGHHRLPCSDVESCRLVVVRTLRKFAAAHDRRAFDEAVKQLSRVSDPNIAQMFGVIRQREPLAIVMEYMPHGDLHQFLQQRVFDDASDRLHRNGPPSLSYGCLIHMATQIASGMKYLAEIGIVHRDLAARTCLVGSRLKVKVANFGLIGGGRYAADYCRMDDGSVLSLRWAALESVVMRKYTSRSDVWSFGVTLWELLSFARRRPYDTVTDSQLIAQYVELCSGGTSASTMRLPQPRVCPREIYDLLVECWHVDDARRPTFREIHMFLTRKNMGYRPVSEASSHNDEVTGNDNLGAAVDIA